MRCHYWTHTDNKKYLIPECMSVVMSNDISDCTCPKNSKSRLQLLEEKVQRLEKRIKNLEK